jgi:hypothetical protein
MYTVSLLMLQLQPAYQFQTFGKLRCVACSAALAYFMEHCCVEPSLCSFAIHVLAQIKG